MPGPHVAIVGGDHVFDRPGVPIIFSGRPEMPETVVEDAVWIGHGAVVLAGTTIGRGAIVAAGAAVAHHVPAYAVVGGVPARILRYRFCEVDRAKHDALRSGNTLAGEICGSKEAK